MPQEKFPQGITVQVHKSASMAEDLVEGWIKSIRFQQLGALLCQRSMLVLDCFQGHTRENVKAKLWEEKINLVFIPGEMTEMLKSLDIIIRQQLKAHI
jgi:hypothetical protein